MDIKLISNSIAARLFLFVCLRACLFVCLIMDNAAKKLFCRSFLCTYLSKSLQYLPKREIAGPQSQPIFFPSLYNATFLPRMILPICTPTRGREHFFTSCSQTCYLQTFTFLNFLYFLQQIYSVLSNSAVQQSGPVSYIYILNIYILIYNI